MTEEERYPYLPGHREALEMLAALKDDKGIPTSAALAAQGELLRYEKVELQKALIEAGEYLHGKIPDDSKWYEVMETITTTLQGTGVKPPWIAWEGELEELPDEEGCTCAKGDAFCPVHNADYARYIRS